MTPAKDCSLNGDKLARHLICSLRLFTDDVSTSTGLAALIIIPVGCVLGRVAIRQFHAMFGRPSAGLAGQELVTGRLRRDEWLA